jgi:SAM-dependent methyltransferase/uncharacterized protein YbaR (Trm112 family)
MLPGDASLLVCPTCHTGLALVDESTLACPADHSRYFWTNGIWRMLTPEAELRLSPFINSYEKVRRSEGRGSTDPDFYRSLPYPTGLDKKTSRHWQLRARSYETLIQNILPRLNSRRPLTIIDVGAGNGWLSNRLASLGHDVVAIDLQVNEFDGLGCQKYYDTSWTAVQAEFDRLPIADASVDLVVYNASLHYSEDLQRTLTEARRVLRPDGRISVIDSPFFMGERAGNTMLRESPYDTRGQIGFLTGDRLTNASSRLDLTVEFILRPRSLMEALDRLVRRLYLRREPATLVPVLLSPKQV